MMVQIDYDMDAEAWIATKDGVELGRLPNSDDLCSWCSEIRGCDIRDNGDHDISCGVLS